MWSLFNRPTEGVVTETTEVVTLVALCNWNHYTERKNVIVLCIANLNCKYLISVIFIHLRSDTYILYKD